MKNKTQEELNRILRKPQEDMAAYYRRIREMIDFVEGYFDSNIDDVAGSDVGAMTLDELRDVLDAKISHYSRFVATSKPGVFRERDELEKWIVEGKKGRESE